MSDGASICGQLKESEFTYGGKRRRVSITRGAAAGYAIPGSEKGRMIALIHVKGNMLYQLGDNNGAASAFEEAVLIAAGSREGGIKALIDKILIVLKAATDRVNVS